MSNGAGFPCDPETERQLIEREMPGQHLPDNDQRELDPRPVWVRSPHQLPGRNLGA